MWLLEKVRLMLTSDMFILDKFFVGCCDIGQQLQIACELLHLGRVVLCGVQMNAY